MQRASQAGGKQTGGDEGSRGRGEPKLTPRQERLASGSALTSSAAHGRGPAPEEDGAQSRSLRALAPHARSAPFAAGCDRGCGRVRSRFGGRRPVPPHLLGNMQASPPHWDDSHNTHSCFRQRTPEGDRATTSTSRYSRRLGGKGRAAVTDGRLQAPGKSACLLAPEAQKVRAGRHGVCAF